MIAKPGPKTASFVERQTIRKEVRRLLTSEDETKNTSVTAVLSAAHGTREAIRVTRQGARFVAKTRKLARERRAHQAGGSDIRQRSRIVHNQRLKALKKVGKETERNTGAAVQNLLYTAGTTDTSANAIHTAIRSGRITQEVINDVHTVYKGGRAITKYVKSHSLKKQVLKSQKEKIVNAGRVKSSQANNIRTTTGRCAQQRAQKLQRKKILKKASESKKASAMATAGRQLKAVASAVGNVVRAVVAHPAVGLSVFILGALLLLFMTIISVISGASNASMNFVMADEETIQQYTLRINELDEAFQARIDAYQNDTSYDDVRIEYMGEGGELKTNWPELLSLMAVQFEQDLTFSGEEQSYLRELFDQTRKITTRTEIYFCSGCCSCGDSGLHCHGHTRLIVQVYSYGMEDIIDDLGWDEDQKEWARSLATSDWPSMFPGIGGSEPPGGGLSADEIQQLISSAPTTSVTREKVRETALSLVGKVPYFWGGKSSAGWNSKWNQPVKVTAAGSSTTGTYQPYGLDCSGFIDWTYKTAGVGNIFSAGGTSYQWGKTYAISQANLQPGDLVFKQVPGSSGTNHVGIYIGKRSDGRNLYCHCAWSQGVTVDSYAGFKYFRRPYLNFGD